MQGRPAGQFLLFTTSLFALCALAMLSGCGTPGVPQPPSLNLAKPVSDLKAIRTGNEVTLTWTVPKETTDRATFRHRGPIRVCQAINQPQISQCNAVTSLNTSKNQSVGTATTAIPSSANGSNDYATYALEVNNDRGRNAGLSNQVQVPTTIVSKLNAAPSLQLTADAIVATAGITEQGPAIAQTLEFRRKEKGTPQEATVAHRQLEISAPGETTNVELRDDNFVWEKTYEYRVVVVASAKVPNGTTVTFDGDSSSPMELVAHDVFPPAVPTGVQAVFSQIEGQPASIDLTWNPNTDHDLAGYFIYRRRQVEPASSAVKLNAQPLNAPAFHDTAIQPGNAYIYSVSAVDERGNESKRSEEASEQVPK